MNTDILVLGGTGKTGRKIVTRLQQLGQKVRVGSRNAYPVFDWHQPNTWEKALENVKAVYISYQPDLAVPGALKAIETLIYYAKKTGVQKLVLLSGKGEREAQLCEEVVIHSGIAYTIVRASWFMQNFSESFFLDPILQGVVALPKAEAKVPYVNTDDIADVAVEALLKAEHNGQIYQLTGSETLTFEEVITKIAKASARNIQFIPVTLEAYTTVMKEQGVPDDVVWLISYLFSEVLGTGTNDEITNDITQVLGRAPKSFDTYVTETVSTGVWNTTPETV